MFTPELEQFAAWLHETAPSQWVRAWPWTWAICETLHFIGLSALVGVIGLLDLRLMGFLRRIPLSALRPLLPYGIAGFVINAVTGAIFFVGTPEQYVTNVAFGMKMLFVVVSGLNVLYFETRHGHRVLSLAPDAPMPAAFWIAGAISLASWFMVLYWGRMLPYIGNAF
jgi:hypothetical protein